MEFTLRDAHFTKIADEGTSLGRQWEKCQGFTLRGRVANEGARARPLRIEYPGAVYHVTSRGNARKTLWWRIGIGPSSSPSSRTWSIALGGCHAYRLMDNHYHLLIETPAPNLSRGMRQLNGRYTQAYNRGHHRVAHLFQGRFTAILIEKNTHLLELCR